MKTLLLFLAVALLLRSAAHAQQVPAAQVPAAAKATFRAKFPTVKGNTWEKEGLDFEAGFKQKGNTMSALITPAGESQETETDIRVEELPAAVRSALARDYAAYILHEAAIDDFDRGGTMDLVLMHGNRIN